MNDEVTAEQLDSSDPRTAAIARLRAKRHLRDNAVLFGALTIFFVVIWALGGAGYFWPAWIILGFVLALGGQLWTLYGRKPITETDIEREMANRS
jgi:fatty acid desaturase